MGTSKELNSSQLPEKSGTNNNYVITSMTVRMSNSSSGVTTPVDRRKILPFNNVLHSKK